MYLCSVDLYFQFSQVELGIIQMAFFSIIGVYSSAASIINQAYVGGIFAFEILPALKIQLLAVQYQILKPENSCNFRQ